MTESPQERNPFTRPGFVVAAVLIALIVIGGIVLLLSGAFTRNAGGQTPSGPAETPTASAGPELTGGESVCGLGGVATTGTADTPPAVEWTVVGAMSVPSNSELGPGDTTGDGLGICYQRTPEGAVIAAANYMGAATDGRLVVPMNEYANAEGPGRSAAIADAKTRDGVGSARIAIAGYRVLGYNGETAKIDLALEYETGELISFVNDMVWEDGDWKIVTTDQGIAPTQPAQISDLEGYVLFGANS